MSGRPLIPSKDALRVLRSLAYSPPAAFIGTAGALCGVVTIHYHERRKVHKVEEILKTKRKLHSISNGRGSARLALMFEAAEKGEDFTIRREKVLRPVGRRRSSTQAKRQDFGDGEEWKPFIFGEDSSKKSEQSKRPTLVSPEGSKHTNTNWHSFPSNPTPSAMAQMLDDPGVTSKPEARQDWHRKMASAKIRAEERRSQVKGFLETTPDQSPSNSTFQSSAAADQPITDLNPLSEASENPVNSTEISPKNEVLGRNPIFFQVDSTKMFGGDSLSSLQPWPAEVESEDVEEPVTNISVPVKIKEDDLDLYIPSLVRPPTYVVEHSARSRYNLKIPKVRSGMSIVGIDRYQFVFNVIMNVRQKYGQQKALEILERVMNLYTTTNLRPDFALVQAIFLDCTRIFSTAELTPIIWRYVDKHLQGDTPKFEVVRFLYPRCGAGVPSAKQHYYFLAHRYLQLLYEQGYSYEHQVIQLRKLLIGTKMCQIEPHEHLIIPVLRYLMETGRMTAAQSLFEEMVSEHKVPVSFYTLQILVQGYARTGNWSKVKSILDDCHTSGLSAQKPYGLVGLLVSTIHDYSLSQPPDKVLGFVKHSIKSYGIQPTSELTRELVSLCLRHRRYDLVTSWVSMIRSEFPHIDIGTSSSTFAFDISCVWRDIDASCEDILAGCRALTTSALRDPFSKVFRSVVSEAMSRYLSPRLQALREKLGEIVPELPTGTINSFQKDLKQLKQHMTTNPQGSQARLMLTDLLNQGEAVRWINALLHGQLQSYGTPSSLARLNDVDWTLKQTYNAPLPPCSNLKDIILKQYAQRNQAGQEIEHESLRQTVQQLVGQGRKSNAIELIQTVYESPWAQPPTGREFSIDLFTDWMKLAWELRSGSKLRSVLWALLDAGPQLKLSSQIILLARIASPKTHLQKTKWAKTHEVDEVEYLRVRLKRRHWSTAPSKKGLVFDNWVGIDKPPGRFTGSA